MTSQILKNYLSSIILCLALILGGLFGYFFGPMAQKIKFLGDIFLNLIVALIVPLVFFSVSSAIAKAGSWKKLRVIFAAMLCVFLATGIMAALLMIMAVKIFPIGESLILPMGIIEKTTPFQLGNQLVELLTVPNFLTLFSHEHMLALILFSGLVGMAAANVSNHENHENPLFIKFLQTGEAVFMRVFSYIMYYAPIGFFAYFATLVSELGPKMVTDYLRIALIYYGFACGYFVIVYSLYAYIAGGKTGFSAFWRAIFLPAATALATCSSAASIPANLAAAKQLKIPPEVYETAIPIGTLIHKEGSIIGGIIKIAFLFSIFHWDFSGITVLLTALGVSLLVGTVMGAIPSGGMLGELLILSIYGFPASILMPIVAISVIVDPIATMLNVTGNTASSLLISRWVK